MRLLRSLGSSALVALAVLVLPTQTLHAQASPDATAIRSARLAQNRAIGAGALDSVATFWVPDIAVVAGLGVTFQGKDAYKAAFAADSGMIYERIPEHVQDSPHWPIAWEQGTWSGRRKGTAPAISGTYAAQWVKIDGRWLIRSELFVALNCSGPACRWPVAPRQ